MVDGTDDVDVQERRRRALRRSDTRERGDRRRRSAGADACDPRACHAQKDDERHEDNRELAPRQRDHASSVAADLCPKRADFVPDV
jgi:hypothetical protein